ncbi:hypothetical protein [Parasitella parasitica]|uniref:BZIP domain-containing protein n=1 Tax=Parasitella parasitica TaxID=35722 RepID=A0A0B7N362_9FUNG|nr:hypothetical protein [Parasitella parasitica]
MAQHCIKTDPAFQEDQEDLLMSYLNSDYLSPSIASPSPTTPKFNPIPEPAFAMTMALSGYDSRQETWHSTPSTPNDDLFRQQQSAITSCFQPNALNNNLQFVMPSYDQVQHQSIASYMGNAAMNMVYSSPYFNLEQNNQTLQHSPASPRSLSSYSSFSDCEQPKKKRGRKKRNPNQSVASSSSCGSLTPPHHRYTPSIPAAIAPAPVKHLATILPASSNSTHSQEPIVTKTESSLDTQSTQIPDHALSGTTANASATTAIHPVVNSNTDLQKAATIAKRQERLIKNRAAALLSRKRKREHLSALEEQCTDLTSVNQSLLEKVSRLEKENLELRSKFDGNQQSASSEKFSSEIISMVSDAIDYSDYGNIV